MANSLTPPHCGYHWDGAANPFFEGWYYRVTLPKHQESVAFMYSIENPGARTNYRGGAVQILGPEEQYLWQTLPDCDRFWADPQDLNFGHWGRSSLPLPAQPLPPEEFINRVQCGYQASNQLNQGYLQDPATGQYCRWNYQIEPVYGWGQQQATAGWLSLLPIFEPGWQILLAHGWASGTIDWNGKIYEFKQAPAYSEKNWGRAFPQQWFWVNCNAFESQPDLALTAVGGKRQVLGQSESVGLIGIHFQGQFYEFVPWTAEISWQVESWGCWKMQARNSSYQVGVQGVCDHKGTPVRVPTAEGLQFRCRDTTAGYLQLTLRDSIGTVILQAESIQAGLEVGGDSWSGIWRYP
ncbi:MAG: tocopherol cyclase family protein [Cyanobacteria bacterium P01_H01_bin.15]